MVNYRMLALDLDETLLTRDKKITDKNKYWIQKATEAGVTVIFATGRGRQRVEHLREELELNTPMVLTNGAEIWRRPGELLKRYHLEAEAVKELHALAAESGAAYWGYNDEQLVGHKKWVKGISYENWQKFGIRHENLDTIEALRESIEVIPKIEMTRSAPDNIEISVKGISKETGVKLVCDDLGLDIGDVMAIGDNLNDFQLIQAAGLGVAMENGDERLKKVAGKQTRSNEEDGVAYAIEHLLFK